MNKKFISRFNQIAAGMSNRAFANKCNISEATVRKAKRGGVPGETMIEKIAINNNVSVDWLKGESDEGGPAGQFDLSEQTSGDQQNISTRDTIIGKMDTIISFLEQTYSDLPSMMDDCLQQMKIDLRKNNPDFRHWEHEQQDKLMNRRKNKERESDMSPNIPNEKEVNGSG